MGNPPSAVITERRATGVDSQPTAAMKTLLDYAFVRPWMTIDHRAEATSRSACRRRMPDR
jgi:hypothetical protein